MNTLTLLAMLTAAHTGAHGHPGHDRGADDLPASAATIEVKGDDRLITANGIPNHEPGAFPNAHNPNSIRAQAYQFRVPVKPVPAEKPVALDFGPFGVALNGVVFDPGTAEFWNRDRAAGWRYEAIGQGSPDLGLDAHHAHVQPNGAYHYHASPTGLTQRLAESAKVEVGAAMILVGWAADGYPIYDRFAYEKADDGKSAVKAMRSGYRLKTEDRPRSPEGPGGKPDGTFTRDYEFVEGAGDLDLCNGRTGVTPEFPSGTYYYVITGEFPYVPRSFHGTPDESFQRRGPGGPGGPGGRRPGRPGGPGGAPPPPPPSGG